MRMLASMAIVSVHSATVSTASRVSGRPSVSHLKTDGVAGSSAHAAMQQTSHFYAWGHCLCKATAQVKHAISIGSGCAWPLCHVSHHELTTMDKLCNVT